MKNFKKMMLITFALSLLTNFNCHGMLSDSDTAKDVTPNNKKLFSSSEKSIQTRPFLNTLNSKITFIKEHLKILTSICTNEQASQKINLFKKLTEMNTENSLNNCKELIIQIAKILYSEKNISYEEYKALINCLIQ